MMESAEKCNGIGICLLMKKFFIAFGTMAAASDEHHWEKEREKHFSAHYLTGGADDNISSLFPKILFQRRFTMYRWQWTSQAIWEIHK